MKGAAAPIHFFATGGEGVLCGEGEQAAGGRRKAVWPRLGQTATQASRLDGPV
jgi:hypothetical protein